MNDPISWSGPIDDAVCICGVGVRTPLGFNASASAAAVRGAISAVAAHPTFVDKEGEPMSLAVDAGFEPSLPIAERIEQMLLSAVTQALGELPTTGSRPTMQCWVGIAEPRPGLPPGIADSIANTVSAGVGEGCSAHVLQRGHASGLMAMQVAAQRVASGEATFCIAAGVDSYHDAESLTWLDRTGFLMSAANRNGFPPGEAASACLLARESAAERHGLPVLARVAAATTAFEPKSIRSTEVCIGEGLTTALSGVISAVRAPPRMITATYCDLNGVRYRNEEFIYTMLRVQEAFFDAHDYQSPADCWGDVGAASGPLFASLAIEARQRGYARGQFPLLWASSDGGHRSAILLSLSEP
ncbi:MAG TPA: beta-ketoacyl synthase N-terminal-like domain-containing protein [Steroidobacteraceae bacterium]|nr:beta-ketoacyl synthase N-terminal-like domain-containing protein [Steroidobacteraceae bacterium]